MTVFPDNRTDIAIEMRDLYYRGGPNLRGYSVHYIAKRYGVAVSTVRNMLEEVGVTKRTKYWQKNIKSIPPHPNNVDNPVTFNTKATREIDPPPTNNHVFLTEVELADLLRVQPATISRWRDNSMGPPFLRIGKTEKGRGLIRYPIAALKAYVDDATVWPDTKEPEKGEGNEG